MLNPHVSSWNFKRRFPDFDLEGKINAWQGILLRVIMFWAKLIIVSSNVLL